MRHRQAVAQDFVAADVDDHAAVLAAVTPSVDRIGTADSRYIGWRAVRHGQPVQMAAILVDEGRNERWTPDRFEAVAPRRPGETVEAGIHEDRLVFGIDADVVRVQRSGGEDRAGRVARIEEFVCPLVRLEHVFEAENLKLACHEETALYRDREAHRLGQDRLVQMEASVVASDQVEQPRLI